MYTNKQILLFSGGIDSYIAWHYLQYPTTLYFNIAGKYNAKEMQTVKKLVPKTIIDTSLKLNDVEQSSGHVPFRNLLFAIQAAKYADTIYIAGVLDDVATDKNENIFIEFSKMLSKLENRNLQIKSPFWHMTKSEIVSWYIRKDLSIQNLQNTISCYSGEQYCGKCASCFRKWIAFWQNGLYLDFWNLQLMNEYEKKAKNNYYHEKRNKAIIDTINDYRSRH